MVGLKEHGDFELPGVPEVGAKLIPRLFQFFAQPTGDSVSEVLCQLVPTGIGRGGDRGD